jgi:hypothetical protein
MATGKKTGGRRKGTPNRRTAEMRAKMAASGEMPLAYMMRIMRDPTTEPHRRDAMAKAAAPYVHPTLAAVAHKHLDAQAGRWRRWSLGRLLGRCRRARSSNLMPRNIHGEYDRTSIGD